MSVINRTTDKRVYEICESEKQNGTVNLIYHEVKTGVSTILFHIVGAHNAIAEKYTPAGLQVDGEAINDLKLTEEREG